LEDNIKWNFKEWDGGGGAWAGSVWLRIGTGGWLLWVRWWTFGFHKKRVISWLCDDLLASREVLSSMELVFPPQSKHSQSATKEQWVTFVRTIITRYYKNHTIHTDVLCGWKRRFCLLKEILRLMTAGWMQLLALPL
jgi:hypothetical protein